MAYRRRTRKPAAPRNNEVQNPSIKRHIMVNAGAGSGKTYCLEATCNQILTGDPGKPLSPEQSAIVDAVAALFPNEPPRYVTVCAFSKAIADELGYRLPRVVKTGTLHSFGYRNISYSYRHGKLILKEGNWKTANIIMEKWKKEWSELNSEEMDVIRSVGDLVAKAKITLAGYDIPNRTWIGPTDDELDALCSKYAIGLNGSTAEIFDWTRYAMDEARQITKIVDYSDMIWIPVVNNLKVFESDLIAVDESQDLNSCQQELSYRMGRHGLYVGDRNQAIFGFAGADAYSFDTLRTRLTDAGGVDEYPLMTTRRCGKSIVRHAKQWVPEYKAWKGNHKGKVNKSLGLKDFAPAPGDMVLCRTNAPLLNLGYKYLAEGIPFMILGRDFAKGLISFLSSFKLENTGDLQAAIEEWAAKEELKLAKRRTSESALQNLADKIECCQLLCTHNETLTEIKAQLAEVFGDSRDAEGKIILASAHKSKGLEANVVWIINTHLMPHPLAEAEWEQEQEANLMYVAGTRAIYILNYVAGDTMKDDFDIQVSEQRTEEEWTVFAAA